MNNTISALHIQFGKPFIILFFTGLAVILVLAASLVYGLPWSESLRFLLAVFFLFYVPGSLLLKYSGVEDMVTGSQFLVSLGVGTVVVPVIYLFFRRYAVPDLVIQSFFALTAVAWFVLVPRNLLAGKVNFQFTGANLVATVSLLLLVILLLHLSHFTDVRLLADGFIIRTTNFTETIFHQGLINALRDTWPPPALYASGGSDFSSYHLSMHLQIELVQRLFSVNSLYLIYFYTPFLYFVLLVSFPFFFVRQIGGSHLLSIVAGALIFGAGFSFVPGMMGVANPAYPWALFFVPNPTIWSLLTLNGYIPSLIALFLCIWFLNAFFRKGGNRTLILITLLVYGAFSFKSSMGLQIAGICLLTGCLMATQKLDRTDGIALSVASLLMLLIMFLDLALQRFGVGNMVIALAPLNMFYNSLNNLGLSNVSRLFYPLLFVLFFAGALGVRTLGFLYVKKTAWNNGEVNWLVIYLVAFVLGGYLLSEMVFLGVPQGMNNAGWFFAQSLVGAWFLLFIFLVQLEQRWKRSYLVFLLILVVAAPTTIQFMGLRYDRHYVLFDSNDLAIVDYLADVEPGAVVLHPLNTNGPALASNLAGRPSVLNIFRSFVSETNRLTERVSDVQTFFSADTNPNDRSAVLQKYGVNYVYGPLAFDRYLEQLPELKKIQSTARWSLYEVEK